MPSTFLHSACLAICKVAALPLLLVIVAGCTTIPEESAMPWNTPQSWEGSPSIPGLSDR